MLALTLSRPDHTVNSPEKQSICIPREKMDDNMGPNKFGVNLRDIPINVGQPKCNHIQ